MTTSGLATAANPATLGTAKVADLQKIVDEAAAASGAVGVQVSAILGDQRADLVYGKANLDLGTPMTVDTVIQVGSVTKVFNAALIMTLVEQNKLSLDTPIVKYIPEFKLPNKQAQDAITLRQLLSMSSGLDNGPYTEHGRGDDALGRYVASLSKVPLVYDPGKGFGYSNAGTSVAGYVAQQVMGVSWDTLLRERILQPAGLEHAVTMAEDLAYYRVSAGHTPAKDGKAATVVHPWYITRAQGPAGSTLTMSAQDLASFGQLFVNSGKTPGGRQVLSEASVRAMMTPTATVPSTMQVMNVGEKWGVGPSMGHWGNTVVWGHSGGNQSGTSHIVWLPEKRGVLSLVCNTPGAMGPFSLQIFDRFANAVFGVGTKPEVSTASPRIANTARYVGTYERYGTRIEISDEQGQLRMRTNMTGDGRPAADPTKPAPRNVIIDGILFPLGEDRFQVEAPAMGGRATVGFFGKDAQGRATNIVDPVFAARRVK